MAEYQHAPITEAVIEIKFASPVKDADLEKVGADYKAHYVQEQPVSSYLLGVGLPVKKGVRPVIADCDEKVGRRLLSKDATQCLMLWPTSFMVAQLAPYRNWEDFFGRFTRDWEIWKKAIGYKEIVRVGVRYINRIDIPTTDPVVEHEKYLSIYPHLPNRFETVVAYATQVQIHLAEIDCLLTINSSSLPPQAAPVLGKASFFVDIDIANETKPPQKDEELFELLGKIRKEKNTVFEACVTDVARELFANG